MSRDVERDVLYVTVGGFIAAILGYGFWFAASFLFSSEEIGSTTLIISGILLISTISRLGIEATFLTTLSNPEIDKLRLEKMISSGIIISSLVGLIISLIMTVFFSNSFSGLHGLGGFFVVSLVIAALSTLVGMDVISDTLLLTSSNSRWLPIKQSLLGLTRILGLYVIADMGIRRGLITSWTIGLFISIILVWGILLRGYFRPRIASISENLEIVSLTFGLNISNLSMIIFPSVALWIGSYQSANRWGQSAAGEFFILWMIGSFALMLPRTFSRVLTVQATEMRGTPILWDRGFIASVIVGLLIGGIAGVILPLFSGMFKEYTAIQFMAWGLVSVPGYIVYNYVAKWRVSGGTGKLLFSPIISIGVFGYCMTNVEMDPANSGIIWLLSLLFMSCFSWAIENKGSLSASTR
tara:strand:+ start:7844 stop:9076 length:1233 start_codon:yes stop_codon:yes gene_type:complete